MTDINFKLAEKERRERIRWFILRTLHECRPEGALLSLVLDVMRSVYRDTTELEIKRELDYLAERDLVSVEVDPTDTWYAKLERFGSDVVEYTVACEPGIARPKFGEV